MDLDKSNSANDRNDFAPMGRKFRTEMPEWNKNIRDKVNTIRFVGCEKVLVGDVLYYPIFYLDQSSNFEWIKSVLRVIVRTMTSRYNFNIKGEGKTLFLFSTSYGSRDEQRKVLEKTISVCNNYVFMYARKRKLSINIQKLRLIKFYIRWVAQLKKNIPELNRAYINLIASLLFEAYIDYYEWRSFFQSHKLGTKNIVSWIDVQMVDCFFTQQFNRTPGCVSVTLQHGFLSTSNNVWACEGSKSKYYICDSKYSMNTIISNGYSGDIKVCGSVYRIGADNGIKDCFCNTSVKKIGVFLNSEELHDINVIIISFFKQFSYHNKDINICFKFHPSSNKKNYNDVDLSFATDIVFKQKSANEVIEEIDMGIISYSNTLIEILNANKPVLIISGILGLRPQFENVEYITFSTELELNEYIRKIESNQMEECYRSLYDLYGTKGDVIKNYRECFKKLGFELD